MKLVFDIETNGLDPDIIWLVVAQDLSTGKQYIFTDYEDDYPGLSEFIPFFEKADTLIGHNIISFDLPVLKKLTGWVPTHQKTVDTMLLSQLNDFYRPQFDHLKKNRFAGSHNMKIWSQFLEGEEKHEDPSWEEYSLAMRERCASDVEINVRMYRYMLHEIRQIKELSPNYAQAIKLEHEFAHEMAIQEANGWLIDVPAAVSLLTDVKAEMAVIEREVEPQLKPRKIWLDKEPREAKVLKSGQYDRVTRDWFGDVPVSSPYRRYRLVEMKLGNNEAVIDLLEENGWQPTEWNWGRNEEGKFFKKSPKLTEDSFDSITGSLGRDVARWRTLRARRAFIEGLLKNRRDDDRVQCRAFTIGTNTYRCRHAGIVNVPGAKSYMGKEVRQLFISEPGRRVVAADSDSNQLRGFAHYLDNPELSDAITSGTQERGTDVHTRTANLAGVSRPVAKTITYALLFGAGNAKLAESAGNGDSGEEIRQRLEKAFPGFKQLTDTMKYQWECNLYEHGRGFIYGMDGRRIYCEQHKCFNAALQAFEAVVMKAACVKAQEMIRAEGLDADLACMMHDELNYDVAEQDAQRVGEILEYALGPYVTEEYALNIEMGGTAEIGGNWYDVH